jgi:hypothetical protein
MRGPIGGLLDRFRERCEDWNLAWVAPEHFAGATLRLW